MVYSKLVFIGFISIHALREEGDVQHGQDFADVVISIHALREEGDLLYNAIYTK